MARKIYDNWQRLVEAEVRKQQMLELFHAPSRTPSTCSIASDSSSCPYLDSPLFDPSFNMKSDEKLESRKDVEEQILAALLHEDDVNKIGIFGTGGIGKTTMAKRIREILKKDKIFDDVIMVEVGRKADIEKIQSVIMKDSSNILIILDDVWENLTLEDIGLTPSLSIDKRCKIMSTSRNEDVLKAMGVENIFEVQALNDDEAWIIFKERVGEKADDLRFQSLAEMFVKECKGLPLAVEILGLALKDNDVAFWVNALLELRNSTSLEIANVSYHVYRIVKLSYMCLSDEEKSIFLLCSLFKEDSDMFQEELVRFGMGLGLFGGIKKLEEARSRVRDLTKLLKDRSLLEDGRDRVNANMREIVRNVAISIASEGDHVYMVSHDKELINTATHISLISTESNIFDLAERLVCPNLHFLRLQCNSSKNLETLVLPDNFFDGIREVKVLIFSNVSIKTMPPSLHLLEQLHTLHLHSCGVKSISVIGQLANLEILSFHDCREIEILPAEIENLTRLKLLEFHRCKNLKTIVPGVISRLVLLEELKMRGSFARWRASLGELKHLSHLVCLEIEVEDPYVITTDIQPFPNVTRFCIKIGCEDKNEVQQHPYKTIDDQQYFHLSLPNEYTPGNWICNLLRRTQELSLEGDGSNKLVFQEFEKVKKFKFWHCSTISHFLDSSKVGVFHVLESLDLQDIANLREICHGPLPLGSFSSLTDLKLYEMPALLHLWKIDNHPNENSLFTNLKSIDIRNCKLLPYLFTLSIARSFVQLEELRVLFCGKMKEIVLNDLKDDDKSTCVVAFLRLRKLVLNSLSSLVVFCRGIESMKFTNLEFFSVRNLPKLRGLDGSSPVFFNQTVEFDSLKELFLQGLDDTISHIWSLKIPMSHFSKLQKLHICACNKLKNLFSPSIARALVMLKELDIKDSLMMTEVIMNVEKDTEKTLFPSLERIVLWRLRSLRSFCQ